LATGQPAEVFVEVDLSRCGAIRPRVEDKFERA
jgi:hypothetical protein